MHDNLPLLSPFHKPKGEVQRKGLLHHLEKALNDYPYDIRVLTNLGGAYARAGILAKAEDVLSLAVRLYPDEPVPRSNLRFVQKRLRGKGLDLEVNKDLLSD